MVAKPLIPVVSEATKKEIQGLKDRIGELEGIVSDLEEQLRQAKKDLSESEERCYELEADCNEVSDAELFLEELVHDRYMHLRPDYDTLEKVLDRAEFVLKYGD